MLQRNDAQLRRAASSLIRGLSHYLSVEVGGEGKFSVVKGGSLTYSGVGVTSGIDLAVHVPKGNETLLAWFVLDKLRKLGVGGFSFGSRLGAPVIFAREHNGIDVSVWMGNGGRLMIKSSDLIRETFEPHGNPGLFSLSVVKYWASQRGLIHENVLSSFAWTVLVGCFLQKGAIKGNTKEAILGEFCEFVEDSAGSTLMLSKDRSPLPKRRNVFALRDPVQDDVDLTKGTDFRLLYKAVELAYTLLSHGSPFDTVSMARNALHADAFESNQTLDRFTKQGKKAAAIHRASYLLRARGIQAGDAGLNKTDP